METALVKSNQLQVSMSNVIRESGRNLPAGLTPDEQYYFHVGDCLTIKQYEELKVKDPNSGHQGKELARYHIGNCLEHVYQLVGLTREKWPTGDFARRIARFIQDTYPFIAPEELIKAVEFGLQGKFPTTKHDGCSIFEHFGVMDLIYISDLMNAYVKFRYDKKVSVEKKIEISEMPARDRIVEMLRKDDECVKALIKEAFEKFRQEPPEQVTWLRDAWFEWLVYIGLLEYNRDVLNAKFNEMRRVRFDKTPQQCMHEVRVIAIYEMFEKLKDVENPFEIFDRCTYLNLNLLGKLRTAKNA